ncbi:dihydrofolate reductase family protein [Brugia malayi]|uniref:dihydrofolate reductase n=2 Tax=Brugia malayi TaxID=6279 RepID=A0A4E9FIQ4_BRUMA|nr:dihydrofolate reductase family protein [Brugia malayi]VIO96294.1 dihydrofolate reductase family protein [Brugia malayi]
MTRTLHMNLIVAVDGCGGIGRNGGMPWFLPAEMARFAKLTTLTMDSGKKNAVIMGRKVWESIPPKFRPLKNRFNVVLSRKIKEESNENVVVARSFESAISLLQDMENIETIWNIGGREVYELGLNSPFLHQMYITRVEGDFLADVFFPEVDYGRFIKSTESEEMHEEKGIKYRYEIYTVKIDKVA